MGAHREPANLAGVGRGGGVFRGGFPDKADTQAES